MPAGPFSLQARLEPGSVVDLQSKAVGEGLALEVSALALREFVVGIEGMSLRCDSAEGKLTINLDTASSRAGFELEIDALRVSRPALS